MLYRLYRRAQRQRALVALAVLSFLTILLLAGYGIRTRLAGQRQALLQQQLGMPHAQQRQTEGHARTLRGREGFVEQRDQEDVLGAEPSVHHGPAVPGSSADLGGSRCLPALFDDQLGRGGNQLAGGQFHPFGLGEAPAR